MAVRVPPGERREKLAGTHHTRVGRDPVDARCRRPADHPRRTTGSGDEFPEALHSPSPGKARTRSTCSRVSEGTLRYRSVRCTTF